MANPGVVGSGAVNTVGLLEPHHTMQGRRFDPGGPTVDERHSSGTFGGDSGGYSRFFIVPKADRADREPVLRGQLERTELQTMGDGANGHDPERPIRRENAHPTVKPTDLMRHLVRLVTPPGGTVLDCFLGSGSTAIACELEGFPWIGIEQDAGYVKIAEARLNGVQKGLGLDVPAPERVPTRTRDSNNLSRDQRRKRNDDRWVNQQWATEEPA